MRWRGFGRLSLAICVIAPLSAAQAAPPYKNEAELVAAVMPTFVDIYNRGAVGDGAGGVAQIQDEVGSGFIIDPSGVIVTNRHVIEGAYALYVTLSDGTHVPAKLIGKALTFDVALIKIDVGRPLPVAKLGDSDKLRVGDRVVAIGNPLGFANSASSGIISAFHRQIGLSNYDDLMQTDATINQGNSGGPMFNMNGEVVGINQAIYTQNKGGSIGIGFSIPINEAKFLLANIKKFGKPKLGWLGITGQTVTAGMARVIGVATKGGVVVSDVTANGSAASAGLQVGDIITKFAGYPVDRMSTLNRIVASFADMSKQVEVIRNGQTITLPIQIKEWPEELWAPKMPDIPRVQSLADLGMTFESAQGAGGPVVKTVVEKSMAWSAGVRPGDIFRKVGLVDVHSTDEIWKLALESRAKGRDGVAVLLGGPTGNRWIEFSGKE